MWSVKMRPKPGLAMRFARSSGLAAVAEGRISIRASFVVRLTEAPYEIRMTASGPVDQMAESCDGIPGGGRIVGGEIQPEAVGAPAVGEEEGPRRGRAR